MRHPFQIVLLGGVASILLVGTSVILFFNATFISIITLIAALLFTGMAVMGYISYRTQQDSKVIVLQVQKQKEAIEQLNTLLRANTGIQDTHNHIYTEEKHPGDFLLGGRYRINRVLGAGSFGCTYLAADTQRPGSPVCVVKELMAARGYTNFLEVARRIFNRQVEILEALGKHS